MGDIRGFADSPFIWQRVMAGGRLKFYNLIAKILIDRERDAMYKIKSCAKKGVRIIRGVINFPSEFGSKKGVQIIRGCGLYAVKDGKRFFHQAVLSDHRVNLPHRLRRYKERTQQLQPTSIDERPHFDPQPNQCKGQ